MLYTKLGQLIAFVVLAYGVLDLALCVGVASGTIVGADVERALGGMTLREAVVKGFWSLVLGLSLGTLTDISRSIAKGNQREVGPS